MSIKPLVSFSGVVYRNAIKKVLFKFDPEDVHVRMMRAAEFMGKLSIVKQAFRPVFCSNNPILSSEYFGIRFRSPIGLAAGFDYEAKLPHILPDLGFGFGTVGTLTNLPYEGNTKPRLGRLPGSKSLMVNKGFKNLGVEATLKKYKGKKFSYPVGVSIGKTNTEAIVEQREAVRDILEAFQKAESSGVPFAYYELNISCPNLKGNVEFYEPAHLDELLRSVATLGIQRPVWIKMPISKSNEEIRAMMDVIVRFSFIKAVILGNLQRDRNHPALLPHEVEKFDRGNFSGMPCKDRSDELIRLAYREYGTRIKVVGCGGVFSAEDAYRKIRLGASLVQLVTGLIFEGPQLVAEINNNLPQHLQKDGFTSLSEAVGTLQ
jgi:dihydroorotate dehydrogenase